MLLLLAKALLLLCAADVAAWLERACGLSFSNRAVERRYQHHRRVQQPPGAAETAGPCRRSRPPPRLGRVAADPSTAQRAGSAT